MTRAKPVAIYLAAVALSVTAIFFILGKGHQLEAQVMTSPAGVSASDGKNVLHSPSALLLLQLVVIIAAAKFLGSSASWFAQPPVVGEIVAGILLGPSLLGWLAPDMFAYLFPSSSLGFLKLLAELGIVLFMFTVGLELNVGHLMKHAPAATAISHASILFPFLLGTCLALWLYPVFGLPNVGFTAFALFMGIAMSITAFPVLARIIRDRGLNGTPLGTLAISCAAIDDVTAWCLLAGVVAIARTGAAGGLAFTVAGTLIYTALMIFVGRPLLQQWFYPRGSARGNTFRGLSGVILVLLASAWLTDRIGIHALFGAFVAGIVLQPGNQAEKNEWKGALEAVSVNMLLPLFFVVSGLRTHIGLLHDGADWLWALVVLFTAVTGKLAGSMLAARWCRLSWRDSFAMGAMMNTRGLVELVVLNIGYDLGILSQAIFSILVIMALVTTAMTGPLLSLAGIRGK